MRAEKQDRALGRALVRLAAVGARLAPLRDGAGFGVFANGDRRRRPTARLNAGQVRALEAEGVLAATPEPGVFALANAGRARVRRDEAEPTEAFVAQHRPIEDRAVMGADGALHTVRGHDANGPLRRLAALRNADGAPWFAPEEIDAAYRLRSDWARSEAGLVRGSDWTSGPKSGAARGANAQEAALAAHCDARRRTNEALEALAAPLRRVVERVCLHEEGLEAFERSEDWPARSGKLALKLGLAQLAAQGRLR